MDARLKGAYGEQLAARLMRTKGYNIYSGNFKTSGGELDLVAAKDDTIAFIEVKTRTEGGMLSPAEAVGRAKRENIKSAAAAYLNLLDEKFSVIRYDIIEIILAEDGKFRSINHIENAF